MIHRVVERASRCEVLNEVVVATDDARIFDHVAEFGKAVMTGKHHRSGTERCLEALQYLNKEGTYSPDDCVINIQGDEPFIDPRQIAQIAQMFADERVQIATLARKFDRGEEAANPDKVKVVLANNGKALYFSREAIPYASRRRTSADVGRHPCYQHLGLYAYRIATLERIALLSPGQLEQAEQLEQLRWLEHDFEIFVQETTIESIAIDTPGDIAGIPPNLLG